MNNNIISQTEDKILTIVNLVKSVVQYTVDTDQDSILKDVDSNIKQDLIESIVLDRIRFNIKG